MSLIAVAGVKGSPGATTAALALAATWPSPPVLVDADPASGDLTMQLRQATTDALDPRAGMVALAVDIRRGTPVPDLTPYLHPIRGGLQLLTGFGDSDEAAAVVEQWPTLITTLRGHTRTGTDVLVDCGRLTRATPTLPLLAAADVAVVVTRDDLGSLLHLRRELRWLLDPDSAALRHDATVTVLPVVAPSRASSKDVAQALDSARLPRPLQLLPALAFSPRDLQLLDGNRPGRLANTLLMRSAHATANALHERAQTLLAEEATCLTPTS